MSNNIYDKYNVNISYLKSDYLKNPLNITINGKGSEKPFKQDLEYLYITLNIRKDELIDYFSCSISTFNRWLKFYNIRKPSNLKIYHTKETNLKRYGVENPFQSNIIKDKIKNDCFQKYGVYYYNQTKDNQRKIQETNLKRYGNVCSLHGNNQQKIEEIFLSKYDVKNPKQLQIFKDKDIQTKILNNTYGKSKIEDLIYNRLLELFKNVKRQYKSKQYPFACDFYIPSKDLYIEYQGYWTHGKEPYIGSNEQLEKVKLWESKNTKHYNNAINVWTIRDPLKRKTAKDNGLNWIEFFNMNDFEHWFSVLI